MGRSPVETSPLFFEKPVESGSRITGAARSFDGGRCGCRRCRAVARHGHPRSKRCALVGLVFHRDTHGYRLKALKSRRGLKVRALLAAVQRCIALRASPVEIDTRRQRRRTIKTARGRNRLHEPRQARASYVNRQFRTRLAWAVVAPEAPFGPVRIHVAVLSILTVAVHGGFDTPQLQGRVRVETERPGVACTG